MFGWFKRKKVDGEFTDEEKEIFSIGDKMLEQLGPVDYISNLCMRLCSSAHEIHPVEIYGHLHTCIGLGASGMVSSLAQIAVWQLESIDPEADVIKPFKEIAVQSSTDALDWLHENGKDAQIIH